MARTKYDVQQVLDGLGETYRAPEGRSAFQHDTFAYLIARIKRPESDIKKTDMLVLLGKPEDVVHAIVTRGDRILADRQIDMLGIPSEFSSANGQYITKLASGLQTRYVLGVVKQMPIEDFFHQQHIEQRPAANAGGGGYQPDYF